MPLERTPKYDAKIESVRKMPQETPEQKAEKKDAAALLRMEAMLDNAQCAEFYVQHILANPEMTREEFLYDAEQSGNIVHPEAAEAFIDELTKQRNQILDVKKWSHQIIVEDDMLTQQTALDEYEATLQKRGHSEDFIQQRIEKRRNQITDDANRLGKEPMDVSHWLGQYLFRHCLSTPPTVPKGKITLDVNNPLALIMSFDDKNDYKWIDPKDNVGGFHQANQKFGDISFPLIAVNADQSPSVQKHEVGHAENSVLKKAIIKKPDAEYRRLVWGHSPALTQKEINTLIGELATDLSESEAKKAKQEKERLKERLLSYALGRAKDELLADYGNTPNDPFAYRFDLVARKDLYDYFVKAGIPVDSAVNQELWDRYTEEIRTACLETKYVADQYVKKGLMKRFNTFRWVLAQIPLEDWQKQLDKSLFMEEYDLLADWDEFEHPIGEDEKEMGQKRKELIKRFHDFISANEDGVLIPELRKMKTEQEAIVAEEKAEEEKRKTEEAEQGQKAYDEALMKIWEEMVDYEKMILDGLRTKVAERVKLLPPKTITNRFGDTVRIATEELDNARNNIEKFFYQRCEQEKIEPNQEFFASYLDDHHWNSKIAKIREDKLPGWQMYTSL